MKYQRLAITVLGIVQGVGFRPYVYRLARAENLSGWVRNFSGGVDMEIEGEAAACAAFLAALGGEDLPPAARIDSLTTKDIPLQQDTSFLILESQTSVGRSLISPDLAICADCRRELLNPADRRYGYPFINCTNCGPRFTIIEDLPYDRPLTTMKAFEMCPPCRREYDDPTDRRFHAQPTACPDCGPKLSFLDRTAQALPGDALALAQEALRAGAILAVKGLGGYHLACDATNEQAVDTLRRRKSRRHRPLALMMPDIAAIRHYCRLSSEEEALLSGVESPIVLLRRREDGPFLAGSIAPGHNRLGIMLPYTPLHVLLCQGFEALVMTSANLSEEPIAYRDEDAYLRLGALADFFLTHDRPIFRRADDSVAIYGAGQPRLLRRSRGYAPRPVELANCHKEILAVGAQEKNTFCLTRPKEAFVSQHMGELDDAATYREFVGEIEYFQTMFAIKPQAIACDLHPDYTSTRYAEKRGLPLIRVQHHHAHLASVLAEHQISRPIHGLIFDGTGYGTDGHLWGGEILYGDTASFRRLAHLLYLPLPGGQAAIEEPWRQALAALYVSGGASLVAQELWQWPPGWPEVLRGLELQVNTPLSSGLGRLFDGVAALCGLYQTVSYEGQAAIGLEQVIDYHEEGAYAFSLRERDAEDSLLLDWRPVVLAIAEDRRQKTPAGVIAARFHRAVARLCLEAALHLGMEEVALSGGCWQNMWLLEEAGPLLEEAGIKVYSNRALPVNDGGIAYGQAAVAAQILGGKSL